MTLLRQKRFNEAKRLLRKVVPVAQRVLGNEHELSLSLREDLPRATLLDGEASVQEKRKALRTLEGTFGALRRVFGPQHPETKRVQQNLEAYRLGEAFPSTTA